MIYETVNNEAPIKQGDIYFGIPRVELSMLDMYEIPENGLPVQTNWKSKIESDRSAEPSSFAMAVRPVMAIVITQDCDATRANDISLCEIKPLIEVYPACKDTKSIKKWATSVLTSHARINLKWFYLPPDETFTIKDRMAVDFGVTLRCLREDLTELKQLRKCRLNDLAYEHFREKLAEYFRRYPYDEWYPLSKEEFAEYKKQNSDSTPFSWQK